MDDGHRPDLEEKGLRFGCGLVFGAVVAFLVIVIGGEVAAFTGRFWTVVAGVAVVCGLLAVLFGDAFWRTVFKWFHWW